MTYDPNIHHRRSIRLKGYDYAQEGLYFITICCQDREHRFGTIENGKMILNDAGKIADECWLEIPKHFPNVVLHEHIIMPNHIHGIIEIANGIEGAKNISPQRSTEKIWQRDYYDIIIRDERAYQNISEYIIRNPEKWEGDKFFR